MISSTDALTALRLDAAPGALPARFGTSLPLPSPMPFTSPASPVDLPPALLSVLQTVEASVPPPRDPAHASSHVLWICDLWPRERVSYVSPSYEHIWGRQVAELYQAGRSWSESVHPDDRRRVEAAFERWLRDPQGERYSIEYRICRPDGGLRHIRDTGHLILSSEGRAARATGIAEDITER